MLDRDLIKHLQSLQHVRPSGAWQERTKAALLTHMVKNQEPMGVSAFAWYDVFRFATTFKGVRVLVSQATIVAVVAGSVLGGGIANSFAEDSLPGDTLYPVKIAMEQAKVSLTQGTENKVKAQSKLAEKRLNEVKKITKKQAIKSAKGGTSSGGKSPAVVVQAIQEFKDQVKVVEKGLEQVKQEVAAPAAAETAKEVGENVKELQKTLEQAKEGATQAVKQDLQKAEVAVSDTATKALEVLVEKQPQAPGVVSKAEVTTLVQDKITTTQAKLAAAVVVSDATDKANTDAGNPAQPSPINDTCQEAAAKLIVVAPSISTPSPQPSPRLQAPEAPATSGQASGGEGVKTDPRLSLYGRGPADLPVEALAKAGGGGEGGGLVPASAAPPVSCAKEKLNDAQKSLATNDLSKALESTKQADKIVQAHQSFVAQNLGGQAVVEKQSSVSTPSPQPSPSGGEGVKTDPRLSLEGRGMPDSGRAGEGALPVPQGSSLPSLPPSPLQGEGKGEVKPAPVPTAPAPKPL